MTERLLVRSPYDGALVGELDITTADEIESKIEAAHSLFLDRSRWLPAYARIEILRKAAKIMDERKAELVSIATKEGGKPLADSQVEVERAIEGTRISAEYIGKLAGEEIPMGLNRASVGRMAFTFREPVGVVASISAFNHPLNLIVHQTAPAIAAGCPVIVKPASTTPFSCLNYLDILYEAGLPKQWCQAVICRGAEAEKIASDPRVAFLSFIGSGEVGWKLKSKLAPGTNCALEHGGVAPVLVEPDADLDKVVPLLTKGGYYHAGQVCVSVQKVFVSEGISGDLIDRFRNLVSSLKVGNPLEVLTEVGPLIQKSEVDRVHSWVMEAVESGAEVLCGGKKLANNCYAPTLLLNPPDTVKVSSAEVFGPVVCLYQYRDRLKAIETANSLRYAFQASVFTKNLDVAFDSVKRLRAASVVVNDHTAFRVDWMPFGGYLESGMGKGGIPYSMKEMTREKLMVVRG